MPRITINLSEKEKAALRVLAEKESREPRAQAALIIRQELERLGFLIVETQAKLTSLPAGQQEGAHESV